MEHKMSQENLYEQDYLGWLEQQKQVLTTGNWEKLDTEHLFEELEGISRSEHRQLQNRLIALLLHLLKWQFQPALQSNSWRLTIVEQRAQIEDLLEEPHPERHISPESKNSVPASFGQSRVRNRLGKNQLPTTLPIF
jgi:hypothetical protein